MKTCSNFIFTILLFLGYSVSSFAFHHIDDLLDNSEITWAAEVYTDYAPNVSHFAIGKEKMQRQYGISTNSFTTLKIQQLADEPIHLDEVTLAQLLLTMPSNTTSKFFKDTALKEPLNYAAYHKITQEKNPDTTFIRQEDGSQKIVRIFMRQLYPHQIELFRVKQILSYNKKTNQLNLTPIAIAPLATKHDKEKQLISATPLFWVPIQSLAQAADLNSSSINWAKRITRYIDTDEVSVVKGKESLAEILNKISDFHAKAPEPGQLFYTFGDMLPMTSKDIKNLNKGIDTIVIFAPVTFEKFVSEIEVRINPETMHKIRIIQDWVWNKETQSISIRFVAFAPILKRYDNKNNFLSAGPLFYKKPMD